MKTNDFKEDFCIYRQASYGLKIPHLFLTAPVDPILPDQLRMFLHSELSLYPPTNRFQPFGYGQIKTFFHLP